MPYPIESGIPAPANRRGAALNTEYNFDAMKAGDSFFVPLAEGETAQKVTSRLRSAAGSWARRGGHNKGFTTESRNEGGKNGVRIWMRESKSNRGSPKKRAKKAA